MKLSIVIPCYNEAATIEAIVDAVLKCPHPSKEIIVVDDCSTDGTTAILRGKVAPRVDRVIYKVRDEGKKINWKDGVRAVWCIIKYNLLRRG